MLVKDGSISKLSDNDGSIFDVANSDVEWKISDIGADVEITGVFKETGSGKGSVKLCIIYFELKSRTLD